MGSSTLLEVVIIKRMRTLFTHSMRFRQTTDTTLSKETQWSIQDMVTQQFGSQTNSSSLLDQERRKIHLKQRPRCTTQTSICGSRCQIWTWVDTTIAPALSVTSRSTSSVESATRLESTLTRLRDTITWARSNGPSLRWTHTSSQIDRAVVWFRGMARTSWSSVGSPTNSYKTPTFSIPTLASSQELRGCQTRVSSSKCQPCMTAAQTPCSLVIFRDI